MNTVTQDIELGFRDAMLLLPSQYDGKGAAWFCAGFALVLNLPVGIYLELRLRLYRRLDLAEGLAYLRARTHLNARQRRCVVLYMARCVRAYRVSRALGASGKETVDEM